MIKSILDDSTLIVIPARGGSKGIPEKNISLINGIPLIKFTINFAQKLTCNENILVSTDSSNIAEISQAAGASCPFLRPKELATDFIGDMPVLKHAVNKYQDLIHKKYKLILMLQPTSPIRYEHQVTEAISKFSQNNYDSLISVSPVSNKFHALKQFEIKDEKLMVFFDRTSTITARQQLSSSYIRNGVLYLFSQKFITESQLVFSNNTGYTVIRDRFINIDTFEDLEEFKKYHSSLLAHRNNL
jgi:CMP-N,N'-diacetyllegionaminic acid synthase